jgi:hypothetical protein
MRLSQPLLAILLILPFLCDAKGIQEQVRLGMRPIHHQHALHRVFKANNLPVAQASPMSRMLEAEELQRCLADESVRLDDDFYINAFADEYETTCTCSETDDSSVAFLFLNTFEIGVNGTAEDFVALWKENVPGYEWKEDFSCGNTCEICSRDYCGILTLEKYEYIIFAETEITAEDIKTNGTEQQDFWELALLEEADFSFRNCFEYTRGVEGTICAEFHSNVSSVPLSGYANGEFNKCTITYNGTACNSCEFFFGEECGGFLADCTNIKDGANIDLCAGKGLDGYFQVLAIGEFTKGECGSVPSSPAPPSPAPPSPGSPSPRPTSGVMKAFVGYTLSAVVAVIALISM